MLKDEELTILVRPGGSGGAAGAVPRRGEAQHRGVVLGELLQTRHIAHMDAVLEIRPHYHHGNIVVSARLPGEKLKETKTARRRRVKRLSGGLHDVCFRIPGLASRGGFVPSAKNISEDALRRFSLGRWEKKRH